MRRGERKMKTDANTFGAAVTNDFDAQYRWEERGEEGLAQGELHGYRSRAGLALPRVKEGVWGGIRLNEGQNKSEDLEESGATGQDLCGAPENFCVWVINGEQTTKTEVHENEEIYVIFYKRLAFLL